MKTDNESSSVVADISDLLFGQDTSRDDLPKTKGKGKKLSQAFQSRGSSSAERGLTMKKNSEGKPVISKVLDNKESVFEADLRRHLGLKPNTNVASNKMKYSTERGLFCSVVVC